MTSLKAFRSQYDSPSASYLYQPPEYMIYTNKTTSKMWLINARTVKLEEFMDKDRPPYAILSHRWVTGQEVTFQDMQMQQNETKSGWTKIRLSCGEALKHKLDYIWIDTCCIDKSSSAELSEAINSMWNW